MPKMNMDTDFVTEPVVFEETYAARLKEVNQYEKDYGEGPVKKLAWVFAAKVSEEDIDDKVEYEAEFDGAIEVAAHTSYATGKNSKFTQLGINKFAGEDWDGDTDTLIDKDCMIDIVQYKSASGDIRNGVDKVRPAKKGKGGGSRGQSSTAAKKDPIALNEEDFDDIPFRYASIKARTVEGIL